MIRWTAPSSGQMAGAYLWGGFSVASNLELPRLHPTEARADLEFRWRFDSRPVRGKAARCDEIATRLGDVMRVAVWQDGMILYEVQGVGAYEVRPDEEAIDFFPSGSPDPMRVEHSLVNAVLPIHAGFRAAICLHASAVTRDGRGTVFAGPSGSGKSTRAWEALHRGALILADDAVVLRAVQGTWFVFPGARTVRLQAPPGARFWRCGPKLEAYVPSAAEPAPLRQIVVLGSGGEEARGCTGAGLFGALLSLQPGWVWGVARTRLPLVDLTSALCAHVERGLMQKPDDSWSACQPAILGGQQRKGGIGV
jgi:hypothetical protein